MQTQASQKRQKRRIIKAGSSCGPKRFHIIHLTSFDFRSPQQQYYSYLLPLPKMATADVLRPQAIHGFNEKAYAFVNIVKIAVDNDTKDDSEDPKTKDVPVFILNSEDFIDLQLYLQASMKLPPTPEVFETVYTRKAFGQFLTKDPSLYDVGLTLHSLPPRSSRAKLYLTSYLLLPSVIFLPIFPQKYGKEKSTDIIVSLLVFKNPASNDLPALPFVSRQHCRLNDQSWYVFIPREMTEKNIIIIMISSGTTAKT